MIWGLLMGTVGCNIVWDINDTKECSYSNIKLIQFYIFASLPVLV